MGKAPSKKRRREGFTFGKLPEKTGITRKKEKGQIRAPSVMK